MRKSRERLQDRIRDAASGYAVMVLSILVFIIVMATVIAIVRLLGGLG